MTSNNKLAWVTLITSQSYLPGVEALAKSLRFVNSTYSLVVLVTPSFPKNCIEKLLEFHTNIVVKYTKPIYPLNSKNIKYAFPQFVEVWTKLRAWELIEYDAIGLLDSDMILLKNMDFILEEGRNCLIDTNSGIKLLASHACVCNIMKNPIYPDWWHPNNCAYNRCESIQFAPEAIHKYKDANIADSFAKLVAGRYFNSGFMVFRPNLSDMQNFIDQVERRDDLQEYQFPEQDLLNEYFAGEWKPLPLTVNTLKTIGKSHGNLMDLDKVYNLHFIMDKPWNLEKSNCSYANNEFRTFNEIWWNTYRLEI